jgi:hypothetical protein
VKQFRRVLALAYCLVLLPGAAFAYVGPGAGLGMLGSLIAVIAALLVALFGFVMFPIAMLRNRRKKKAK